MHQQCVQIKKQSRNNSREPLMCLSPDAKQQMCLQHSNIGRRVWGGLNHNTALVICQSSSFVGKAGEHASPSRRRLGGAMGL